MSLPDRLLGPNLRIRIVRLMTIAFVLYALVKFVSGGAAVLGKEDVRTATILFVIGALATLLQVFGNRLANNAR